MTWVTFRRFRFELVTLTVALAALAAWLIGTGLQHYAAFDVPYVGPISAAACARQIPQPQPNSECYNILTTYLNQFQGDGGNPLLSMLLSNTLHFLIALVPALVGAMLGGPLIARELERGTFRLVWAQGITRGRWLWGSVIAATLATIALVGAITLVVTWWSAPLDQIVGHFSGGFEMEGLVPLAYALFALALGIALGLIVRSSVPALFITLLGFFLVRSLITQLATQLYAYFMPPLTITYDSSIAVPPTGPQMRDWVTSSGFVDHFGDPVSQDLINGICGANDPTTAGNPTSACVHAHGWLYTVTWQPDSRFWAYQGIESAIYLALALAVLAVAIWWVRRRPV
ncbi:MAG: hypothetical protein OJF49_000632 [Ktedonobacterales bacterium]|jgi:ABC-type transport system involved in multi-copper enzyme maturation permease subunit|nr:MAG: hypothetical protein OJF49_000632 [Ktedonobacterales bacterium]